MQSDRHTSDEVLGPFVSSPLKRRSFSSKYVNASKVNP